MIDMKKSFWIFVGYGLHWLWLFNFTFLVIIK